MQNIKGGDSVKNKLMVVVIIMVTLVFSGCGKISDLKTASSKHAVSQNIGFEVVTSSIISSEPSSELSEPAISSDNQSSQASLYSVVSSAVKSKLQSSSKPPATQPKTEPVQQSSTIPTSSAPTASPYRKNCWGTPEMMENDLAVYAAGIGMQYDKIMTLDDGHWTTPLSSWGASDAKMYKEKLSEAIQSYLDRGYTRCRVIFGEHETLNAYLAYIVVD